MKTAREMESQNTADARRKAALAVRLALGRAATAALILGVRVYRCTLSPAKVFLLGPLGGCRFEPSCSAYALEALRTHGALAGSWLALKRLGRCHPWGGCGHDPVPPRRPEGRRPKVEEQKPAAVRDVSDLRGALRPARPTLQGIGQSHLHLHPQQH